MTCVLCANPSSERLNWLEARLFCNKLDALIHRRMVHESGGTWSGVETYEACFPISSPGFEYDRHEAIFTTMYVCIYAGLLLGTSVVLPRSPYG
jgi:hypothetical protein